MRFFINLMLFILFYNNGIDLYSLNYSSFNNFILYVILLVILENRQNFVLIKEIAIIDCSLLDHAIEEESNLYNILDIDFLKSKSLV